MANKPATVLVYSSTTPLHQVRKQQVQLSEHGKFNLKLGLRAKTLGDNKVVYELQIKK